MPVATPDKRYRRAHLKPGRKRPGLPRLRWSVPIAIVGLLLSTFIAHRALTGIADLSIFKVQKVVVHGNHRLSSGEVLALLDGLQGRSILGIELGEWRSRLMTSPWVGEALLRRTLPATIDVTIQERVPLGIGRINGALYLVDDRGAVIDEYGPNYSDLDLPIIDGLSAAPGETDPDVSRAVLVRRLIDALRARNMASRISQIDVTDARNAVVLVDGDGTLVRLGDERFVERLRSYLELAPALRERVSDIDYVDMRFDERVYVRPVHQNPAGAASTAAVARPSRDRITKRKTQTG